MTKSKIIYVYVKTTNEYIYGIKMGRYPQRRFGLTQIDKRLTPGRSHNNKHSCKAIITN